MPIESQTEFAALLINMCKMQPELESYAAVFAEAERSGTQVDMNRSRMWSSVGTTYILLPDLHDPSSAP